VENLPRRLPSIHMGLDRSQEFVASMLELVDDDRPATGENRCRVTLDRIQDAGLFQIQEGASLGRAGAARLPLMADACRIEIHF